AAAFALEPARPNPTAGATEVPLVLARPAAVEAVVYDALGRRVAVLASGWYEAGRHALTLDPAEAGLPAGVYLVRAAVSAEGGTAGGGVRILTQRVTLTR